MPRYIVLVSVCEEIEVEAEDEQTALQVALDELDSTAHDPYAQIVEYLDE